jgi:nucleoside-diphosphate-sugar epimerase
MAKKILVTGSAGGVGRVVCKQLTEAGHQVRGLDRISTPGIDDLVVGDILDRVAVLEAAAGMDAVIHLAATPDESDFLTHLLEPNVRGLYHVCDAARRQGVKRLILASSVQVAFGHDWSKEPVRLEDGPRVINHYALTKLWAEDLGEMYARVYEMSVIAARLGWLPRSKDHAEELQASPFGTDLYLSHGDAGRFFLACVEADLAPGRFEALYVTSKPARQEKVDISAAEKLIGYTPRDRWPEGQPYLS